MTAQNKQLVQKLFDEVLNKRNFHVLTELVDDNYTGIAGKKGPTAFAEPAQQLINALPDVQWTIMEIIAEGNKVMVKWRVDGTHQGTFNGFATTGNNTSSEGIGIFTIRNGKIFASQILTDRLGFLQQINALPTNLAPNHNAVQFIDKFLVPQAGIAAFNERMHLNRIFIKTLPGFVKDEAYSYTNTAGDLICITIAEWETLAALDKAKEKVQAEYKKQRFDPTAFFQQHKITADRGIYTKVTATP